MSARSGVSLLPDARSAVALFTMSRVQTRWYPPIPSSSRGCSLPSWRPCPTGTWSARNDVPPPAGTKPIFEYKVVNDYMAFLTDEAQLVALRKRFEGYTGPVVNVGGVR